MTLRRSTRLIPLLTVLAVAIPLSLGAHVDAASKTTKAKVVKKVTKKKPVKKAPVKKAPAKAAATTTTQAATTTTGSATTVATVPATPASTVPVAQGPTPAPAAPAPAAPAPAPPAPAPAAPAPAPGTPSASGQALYTANCSLCHGGNGTGGEGVPPINAGELAKTFPRPEDAVAFARAGSPARGTGYGDPARPGGQRIAGGGMRPVAVARVSDADLRAIIDYMRTMP